MEPKHQGEKLKTSGQAKLVLAVDDYPQVLSSLEHVLRSGGYEVITAGGGEQALSIIESHDDLALVISDYIMRGISGREVLNATKRKHSDAARIALTGDVPANTILECLNSGLASHMVMKPWNDQELLQTVRDALALRALRLENRQLKSQDNEQSTAIEQQDLRRLEETIQDLVALLAFLLDLQGEGSRGHSKRVAQLSSWLAQVKGLPAEEVRQIEIAALLKNLGGATAFAQSTDSSHGSEPLPDSVQKTIGIQLLRRIAGFEQIADMVSGLYGIGEAGDKEKPLGSEVLAVADSFDREMFPSGESIVNRPLAAEHSLVEMRGGQLDAELVDTFRAQVLPGYVTSEENEIEVSINQLQPGMVIARDVINVQSVPLLYAGTTLAAEDIARLIRNDQFNAVFSRIFIKVSSLPKGTDEPAEPPPPPGPIRQQTMPAPSETATEVTGAKSVADPGKSTIVVIDDEKNVVAALKRELESSGYRVKGFTDPAAGLDYVRYAGDLHAVICDFQMPGMLGDKLLSTIQDINPDLPCIMITSHATMDTITLLAKSVKMTRLLAKPWDKAQLLETLKSLKR